MAHLALFGVSIDDLNYINSFFTGYFIKIFPLEWFGNLQIKEEPLTDEQEAKSLVSVLRKSHRQSVREGARATREFN